MLYRHERIKHQTQPTSMSCIATCMAMLVDRPAHFVDQEFSLDYMSGVRDVPMFLAEYGSRCIPWLSAGIHQFTEGKLYLATVPSLQLPGLFHQIIIDTRFGELEVYDPTKGYDGKLHYVASPDTEDKTAWPLRSFIIDYEIILPAEHHCEQSDQGVSEV